MRQRPLVHQADEQPIYTAKDKADLEAAFGRAKHHLFAYQFYLPIVHAKIRGGQVADGMVIEQDVRVGPLRPKARVKVVRVWDEQGATFRSAGFTYEALPGHPERGVASFAVIQRGNEVHLRIASDSAPNAWYAKLFAPIARRLQAKAVRTAFRNMRALVHAH